MLKECIDIFKSELNYKGERLLLDSYIPTDGTYIIVAKENDNFIIKEENIIEVKYDKKEQRVTNFSKELTFLPLPRYDSGRDGA